MHEIRRAMKENYDKPTYIIKDMETLRAIADPLRTQILELLVKESQTVKQVGKKLGLAPGKLYYHFNTLEKFGMIEVAETRQVANMIEKLYRATATEIDLDPSLLSFSTDQGKESIHTLLTSSLDSTRDDLVRSLQARAYNLEQGASPQPRKAFVKRAVSRIPDDRADEFAERVMALLDEFESMDVAQTTGKPDQQTYALTVVFYPSYFYQEEEDAN
jgi:DNA-binding transcriptional ArsR family regulator